MATQGQRGTAHRGNGARTAQGSKANGKGGGGEVRLATRVGPVEIDWPRSLGFFGGITVAVAAGVIDPPLGVFIAAVPFLKMLDLPLLPNRVRFVAQVFEGVAKPVGGDSEGTVRVVSAKGASDGPVESSG